MNPPFDKGGKIICSARDSLAGKAYIIGPVSMYKTNDNFKYVEDIKVIDTGAFTDADITKNLAIVKMGSTTTQFETYAQLEIKTYNPKYKAFYEKNLSLPRKYFFTRCDNSKVEDFDFDTDYVDGNRLVDSDTGFMDGGKSQGYIWNVLRRREITNSGLSVIHFYTPKARENFTTWAYSDCRNGLANKLLFGINKKTVSEICSIFIPQIGWDKISDSEVWKAGEYDKAVLKEMGIELLI